MILCIETATPVCSVALCDSEKVISIRESHENKSHASLLTVFILDIFKEQGLKASDLDAVAVSKGPGSYTGLRIGVSTAKGIAFGSGIPLIGIDTTRSIFVAMKSVSDTKGDGGPPSFYCPMIDARRMEVFYCIYDHSGKKIREIVAGIIEERSFSDIPEEIRIIFSGDGSAKCREVLKRRNMVFYDDLIISAQYMRSPANEAFIEKRFEDIAYFEPFYLKDFIATIPKNKIF